MASEEILQSSIEIMLSCEILMRCKRLTLSLSCDALATKRSVPHVPRMKVREL